MVPKVAFITSAAKGLGHATVQSLLAAGWDVFFTYGNSQVEAQELMAFAKARHRRAVGVHCDLQVQSEVVGTVHQCLKEFGRVDALIHNFGPFIFDRVPLSDYTDEMWSRMMDGNLTNFLWLYREVVDGMRRRAFGRIVTIGYDGAGDATGWRFRAAYSAAKSGLAALTKSIAREERQNGITANMVCPGDIRGSFKMQMIGEVECQEDPLGRPPVGEDIGRLIVFLCEERSQQLNGTVTGVTGGYDILAYDDGKHVVAEPESFSLGDSVWVWPWQSFGTIQDVNIVPNRYVIYEVSSGENSGHFTAYQLSLQP